MEKVRKLHRYVYQRIIAYGHVFTKEGPLGIIRRMYRYILRLFYLYQTRRITSPKDFLIISGCFLDAPHRYRGIHQKEQLEKQGLCGDLIFFDAATEAMADRYDIFILYRVPITDRIRNLIKRAKQQNKLCIFDIDDLLFEEKFVKDRYELDEMTKQEREIYLDGIRRQKETLELCDLGTGSTEIIVKEMKPFVKDTLVNRNSLSDLFIEVHERAYKEGKEDRSTDSNEVIIGYFSGSKSHNHDFQLIKDVLKEIMRKHSHVKLLLTGYLHIPKEFKNYEDRVIIRPFVKWDKFPKNIMACDINIVPSEDSYFNNAKSEIKFLEAALVRKPTVASARDAFQKSIKHGTTGFLAETKKEWKDCLEKLISDPKLRRKLGEAAYSHTIKHYTTQIIGENFYRFLKKHAAKKITYYLPSLAISGGIIVAIEHLSRLQKRGFNVSIITTYRGGDLQWFGESAIHIPIILNIGKPFQTKFDILTATMWSTAEQIMKIDAQKKFYLIQGKEYLFLSEKRYAKRVKKTYSSGLTLLTVSKWCQSWLKSEFDQDALLIPNGIDLSLFNKCKDKNFHNPVRILIEGDPESEHKNVDESFKILEGLEIPHRVWFVSYQGKPKDWYRYDRFFQRAPRSKMTRLFCECDILLKTSKLESFSYPPLEMMASGGVCVVAANPGSDEYVKHGVNALTYTLGNIDTARSHIVALAKDVKLRKKLVIGGLRTARKRDWKYSMNILEELYNGE